MTLTLDLTPEILARLTQAAIASGISVEDYTLEVITKTIAEPAPPNLLADRQARIEQMRDFRDAIVTHGAALSQTIIDSREGERY